MNWPDHLASTSPPEASNRELFGAHTRQAMENFAVRGPQLRDHPELVHAVAQVKMAAAWVNARIGLLEPAIAEAIVEAAREIGDGLHDHQFVLPVVQGGGGTSTNMTINEVLAGRASQILRDQGVALTVHPNDHVNRSQSTNDVMPTAIALAVRGLSRSTIGNLEYLDAALQSKAAQYPDLEHLGRTCLQDAVALPVSAVHHSHAYGIRQAVSDLRHSVDALLPVPLGGTAVGTGVGAPSGFAELVVDELGRLSGHPLIVAENPYYAMASLDPLVAVSEAIARCARAAARIAADLRLLASGPVGGLGEVNLPAVQAGSSIMPGKVNPVIPELVLQISFQIAGEATSARLAAGAGELEVSAMAPVVTLGLLAGLERLGTGVRIFADRCIAGLTWNEEVVRANLAGSLSQAVVSATTDGYDLTAARHRNGRAAPPSEGSL